MKKFAYLMILTMFVSSMAVLSFEMRIKPASKTWYVGPPPAHFSRIQEAIDNSSVSDGDIIEVHPKVLNEPYYENVTVYKALKIRGVPLGAYPIVDGLNYKIVFKVTAPYVEISGFTIRNGLNGIRLMGSSARVSNNTFASNYYGIYSISNSTTIINNIIKTNYYGAKLSGSYNNTLQNNLMSENTFNFGISGKSVNHYIHAIDNTNTVDGKPIAYLVNCHDEMVPPNAGYVAIVNSNNITGEKLTALKSNNQTILVVNSTNVTIRDLVINGTLINFDTGIEFVSVTNSLLNNVTIQGARRQSILIQDSGNNVVMRNKLLTLYHQSFYGILLNNSDHNLITYNEILTKIPANFGIMLNNSNHNLIFNNIITNTTRNVGHAIGLYLLHSHNNTLISNTISTYQSLLDFYYILWLFYSNETKIYRNNFLTPYPNKFAGDNTSLYNKTKWDNEYEGNYWNYYIGEDNGYGGRTPKDGIGDTALPYLHLDNYPLMKPWDKHRTFSRPGDFTRIMKLYTYSNSTIELATFIKTDPQIGPLNFTYYKGEIWLWITSGDTSCINITIPRIWLDGNFTINIDEQNVYPIIMINATYSSFSVNYSQGKHLLKILGAEIGHVIGDIDGDGDVDIFDVVMVTGNYGKKETP